MVCISWYALGMIYIHTYGRCLGRSWIHHHTQGGRDQSVNVCQGDRCRYGTSMNAMLLHFTSYLVAWPWLTHFLLRPVQLLVLCPLCPLCLHLYLVQSWASQGVPVLRTSTISMIQVGSRRRKCPWSYYPKVSLGLKGMQSLALHERGLCIKFRPSVFISALPHHPLCVLVLPRPRKRLFDWSLCLRVSQCILSPFPIPPLLFHLLTNTPAYLWKIHAKRIHIQTVQKACEALAKPRQALVHELQVHEVRLQIGHAV